jgi:hypothetical protein
VEEGFGEKQRVSPIIKKAFSTLIPRLLAAGRFICGIEDSEKLLFDIPCTRRFIIIEINWKKVNRIPGKRRKRFSKEMLTAALVSGRIGG